MMKNHSKIGDAAGIGFSECITKNVSGDFDFDQYFYHISNIFTPYQFMANWKSLYFRSNPDMVFKMTKSRVCVLENQWNEVKVEKPSFILVPVRASKSQ